MQERDEDGEGRKVMEGKDMEAVRGIYSLQVCYVFSGVWR